MLTKEQESRLLSALRRCEADDSAVDRAEREVAGFVKQLAEAVTVRDKNRDELVQLYNEFNVMGASIEQDSAEQLNAAAHN